MPKEREKKTHRNETPDPRIYTSRILFFFSHARNISSCQHGYICSLGLFMNLRCMLIESVLKHQIKFALFFIRIKWNKIRSNAKRIFAFIANEHYFVHVCVFCSVLALSLHGTCLSVVFFCMFEAWHGSLRYMMGSMLQTPHTTLHTVSDWQSTIYT